MFDIYNIFVLISFFLNITLALFVHFRASKDRAHIAFEVAIGAIAFWALSMILYRSTFGEDALLWARILYFTASFTAPAFFFFSLFFPKEKPNKMLLLVVFLSTAIAAGLSLIPGAIIEDVKIIPNQEKIIKFGYAYPFYVIHIAGFFTGFYILLFKRWFKYKKIDPVIKAQIQYILLSTTFVSSFAMLTNLFLPTFGIFRFNWLGQVLTTFWVGGITYAIIRHHLMDIRLIVARAIAYVFLLIIVSAVYVTGSLVFGSLYFGLRVGIKELAIYIVLSIVVALSFNSLKKLLESITDKVLYKGNYDTDLLLARLGHVMSTNIELKILSGELLRVLTQELRVTRGVFVFFANGKIYDEVSVGFKKVPNLSFDNLMGLVKSQELFVFEDLEEGPIKQSMRDLEISISLALKVKGEVIGILLLGEKGSGEVFSTQDLKLLGILAPEMAVAIQNSQSYDKIKRFNITLTEEIKKATADLQHANQRLEELDRLKDDFVSVASHELRTPMTAIRSYAWMALYKADVPLSERMKRYLSRTLISTERLINLVNDMLNISRIESGRVEISPVSFDMQTLISDVLTEVEVKAKEKNLQLRVLNTQLPQVFADTDKVHQVLLNLLGNAMKFTPVDGVIEISFFSDGKVVETSIRDSGVGISKDDLPRLFKKFERLDNSYVAAAASGGTGLGLYICKSLIELMRGKVWANSLGLGKGSTFTFALPVATPDVLAQAEKYTRKVDGEVKRLEPASI